MQDDDNFDWSIPSDQKSPPYEDDEFDWKISFDQWRLFFFVLVLGIAGIFYKFLQGVNLQDSAALYIGLPLILALGLSLTPRCKSALTATMKGLSIVLLLSPIVFREGYICVLFSAPIFYFVGLLVASLIDYIREKRNNYRIRSNALAGVIALLSLEGTTPLTSFPRNNEVSVTKVLNYNTHDIYQHIKSMPLAERGNAPFFLKIFPYPSNVVTQGLKVGDETRVHFIAYKHIWWNKIEGDLVMKVEESTSDRIKFNIIRDDSYIGHYLKWETSEIFMEPLDKNLTRVTWKLRYKRIYDPAWYFGPLQHYAVKLSAEELITHVATPRI